MNHQAESLGRLKVVINKHSNYIDEKLCLYEIQTGRSGRYANNQ